MPEQSKPKQEGKFPQPVDARNTREAGGYVKHTPLTSQGLPDPEQEVTEFKRPASEDKPE